jgi:hypothetical protein
MGPTLAVLATARIGCVGVPRGCHATASHRRGRGTHPQVCTPDATVLATARSRSVGTWCHSRCPRHSEGHRHGRGTHPQVCTREGPKAYRCLEMLRRSVYSIPRQHTYSSLLHDCLSEGVFRRGLRDTRRRGEEAHALNRRTDGWNTGQWCIKTRLSCAAAPLHRTRSTITNRRLGYATCAHSESP